MALTSADPENSLEGVNVRSMDGILSGVDMPDSPLRVVVRIATPGSKAKGIPALSVSGWSKCSVSVV